MIILFTNTKLLVLHMIKQSERMLSFKYVILINMLTHARAG